VHNATLNTKLKVLTRLTGRSCGWWGTPK